MEYILVLISSLIIQNIVFVFLTGLEVFIVMESKKNKVFMLTFFTTGLSLIAFFLLYPLETFILQPLGITILQPIIYILILFLNIFILKKIIGNKKQSISEFLNEYLILIVLNSAFLGVSIMNSGASLHVINHIIYIIGTGLGYGLMLFTFVTIKARIRAYQIPKTMEGLPISLIILGIISMSLLGLAGII